MADELDTLREAGRHRGIAGNVAWFDRRGNPFELSGSGLEWLDAEQTRPPPGVVVAV